MKKPQIILGLCAAAILAVTQYVSAQGYIDVNNYDAGGGTGYGFVTGSDATHATADNLNVLVTASTPLYVELLGGSTVASMQPVLPQLTSQGINPLGPDLIHFDDNGTDTGTFFDLSSGPAPTVAGLANGFWELYAWMGSPTLAGATWAYDSGIWTQAAGTAPVGTDLPSPAQLNIPASGATWQGNAVLVLYSAVPEPGTIALAGLGAAALLIFRRRR